MKPFVKPLLVAAAGAAILSGCATYDYGYGYTQPSYGYGYDYGPSYYDYGSYYGYAPGYYVGPPAVGFDFRYRDYDRDRDWRRDHGRRRDRDDHRGRGDHRGNAQHQGPIRPSATGQHPNGASGRGARLASPPGPRASVPARAGVSTRGTEAPLADTRGTETPLARPPQNQQ